MYIFIYIIYTHTETHSKKVRNTHIFLYFFLLHCKSIPIKDIIYIVSFTQYTFVCLMINCNLTFSQFCLLQTFSNSENTESFEN